jgi:DNA damage-binding protein 1
MLTVSLDALLTLLSPLFAQIAKDFNANWVTAIEMLNNRVYLGAENWNNLFCLRRNVNSQSEEIRCRLDNIGEFHFGEMVNKFMCGSLVMPLSSSSSATASKDQAQRQQRQGSSPQKKQKSSTLSPSKKDGDSSAASATRSARRPLVTTGSQTLFGTVDGTLGVVLGMDGRTAAFFGTLERALATIIRPVGDFSHAKYRACEAENRLHPAHGFIDGDLVESFLDLDRHTMQLIADEMNRDGGWEVDDSIMLQKADKKDVEPAQGEDDVTRPVLTVEDILAMVEEITMLH